MSTKSWTRACAPLAVAFCALAAQAQGGPPPIDQGKIDAAIRKGVAYLKGVAVPVLAKPADDPSGRTERELVLWTLAHAEVPETDPVFAGLLKEMLERPLQSTYCVALQAMILEEIGRVKYQRRIWQCAQFLVDNQCQDGSWCYGSPTIYANETSSDGGQRSDAGSGGVKKPGVREFSTARVKPEVKTRLKVEKKRDGNASGDNSNTQYAALGMRACHDAGIILPDAVIEKAMAWYRQCQKAPEGPKVRLEFKDNAEKPIGPRQSGVMQGVSADPRGWCYGQHDHPAYGSMSAGSVGGLAIWDYIKDNDGGKGKRSWRKDPNVLSGIAWLAKNFSVTYNPGAYCKGNQEVNSQDFYYYYLYALERAAMLFGTETIGSHWWYAEGAKVLLERQGEGGNWGPWLWAGDTCFAILFLKRATRPLVASTDRFAPPR